ncbi:MAG: single-stranded DNA-binding protein [Neisseriaceae bacterium]|nr:single-stranded DNA-binding protein [Neisseriaceae bacterium]
MAVFLNEVTLMGNLTTDPEMGEYADGTPVCRFSIAIKKQWKDPNGEKQEKSIFLPIIFTGNMVTAYIQPFIHRGDNVWLRGEVNPYSFTKADGTKAYGTNIVGREIKFIQSPQNKNQSATATQTVENEYDDNPF